MAITLVILSDKSPKYFSAQNAAFTHHYNEGGYLWKSKPNAPVSEAKQWLNGIPPVGVLANYELFMVDGRKPTEEDIKASTPVLV